MRKGRVVVIVALALLSIGLAGCSNTQGTAANPDLTKESVNYKNNEDPQNTGAGSGSIGKPNPNTSSFPGSESPSQSQIKGTASAPEAAQSVPGKK